MLGGGKERSGETGGEGCKLRGGTVETLTSLPLLSLPFASPVQEEMRRGKTEEAEKERE